MFTGKLEPKFVSGIRPVADPTDKEGKSGHHLHGSRAESGAGG
jgi:hypothetical protein